MVVTIVMMMVANGGVTELMGEGVALASSVKFASGASETRIFLQYHEKFSYWLGLVAFCSFAVPITKSHLAPVRAPVYRLDNRTKNKF